MSRPFPASSVSLLTQSTVTWSLTRNSRKRYRDHLRALVEYGKQAELESAATSRLFTERRRHQEDLESLCSLDYTRAHRAVDALRMEHTGDWLFKNELFRQWMYRSASAGSALFGIPGSGKTLLASKLISSVRELLDHNELGIGFNYCDFAQSPSRNPPTIVASLVKQLLRAKSAESSIVSRKTATLIARAANEKISSSFPAGQHLLQDVVALFTDVLVVLDGIDEMETIDQRQMLGLFERLLAQQGVNVKIFVTCRQAEIQIQRGLQSFSTLVLDADNMSNDISHFIKKSVREKIDSGELTISDPSLEPTIVNQLTNGAKEM